MQRIVSSLPAPCTILTVPGRVTGGECGRRRKTGASHSPHSPLGPGGQETSSKQVEVTGEVGYDTTPLYWLYNVLICPSQSECLNFQSVLNPSWLALLSTTNSIGHILVHTYNHTVHPYLHTFSTQNSITICLLTLCLIMSSETPVGYIWIN